MTFEFDSKVHPKVGISETELDDIQSALMSYNQHRHAIASTGNPASMGVTVNLSVEDDGEGVIPQGSVINSFDNTTITIDQSASATQNDLTIRVGGNLLIYNCSTVKDSKDITLNPQVGFMDSYILDRVLTNDINGSITNTKAPDGLGNPRELYIMMSPDSPYYISSINLMMQGGRSSSLDLDFIIRDIDNANNSLVDERVIWSKTIDSNLTRINKSFIQQSTTFNTYLKAIDSSSEVYSRLLVKINNSEGLIESLNYNLQLYKVVL